MKDDYGSVDEEKFIVSIAYNQPDQEIVLEMRDGESIAVDCREIVEASEVVETSKIVSTHVTALAVVSLAMFYEDDENDDDK